MLEFFVFYKRGQGFIDKSADYRPLQIGSTDIKHLTKTPLTFKPP